MNNSIPILTVWRKCHVEGWQEKCSNTSVKSVGSGPWNWAGWDTPFSRADAYCVPLLPGNAIKLFFSTSPKTPPLRFKLNTGAQRPNLQHQFHTQGWTVLGVSWLVGMGFCRYTLLRFSVFTYTVGVTLWPLQVLWRMSDRPPEITEHSARQAETGLCSTEQLLLWCWSRLCSNWTAFLNISSFPSSPAGLVLPEASFLEPCGGIKLWGSASRVAVMPAVAVNKGCPAINSCSHPRCWAQRTQERNKNTSRLGASRLHPPPKVQFEETQAEKAQGTGSIAEELTQGTISVSPGSCIFPYTEKG